MLAPLQALIAQTDRGDAGPTAAITLTGVDIGGATAKPADVWLVHYEPRPIEVSVKAGENTPKALPQHNIVRELVKLGRWTGGPARFALPTATRPGLATAAFVQVGAGGPIIAAVRGRTDSVCPAAPIAAAMR